jgi:hypothetical protein
MIPIQDARSVFTKALVDVYMEKARPTSFLRAFFRVEEKDTKEVSIEVERNFEKVAVDVQRGTEGKRNKFSLSAEKIFVPPYYREYMDMTELTHYDRLFGKADGEIGNTTLEDLIVEGSMRVGDLIAKIERAYELQAAQVFQTGVVQLVSGDNIDYRRDAASIVDLGGAAYWTQAAVDPVDSIKAACNFIRQRGKAQGDVYNMILGETALDALLNNPVFQAKADLRRVQIADVSFPVRTEVVGGTLHGRLSAGSYLVNIWTYPEFYDDDANASQPYIASDNAIILPTQTRFVHSFAAVPKIVRNFGNAEVPAWVANERGQYMVDNYVDDRLHTHIIDVKSAGLLIPTAVDTIYTMKVS